LSQQERRFIESPYFPVKEVNQASASEKLGGGRPDFWEMVFWWTRKPLAGARAVIAGSVLPDTINQGEFIYRLRLGERTAHRHNTVLGPWAEKFKKLKLLDPFAGFGSIPLEAIRLSIGEVVAVELLSTAYVFLKAVLEYPKWAADKGLGKKLVEDVKKWGEWVLQQLKNDQDIKELYDEDVAVYIGTWEVKCPHCGKWTPLVGNWWLARVRRGAAAEEEEEEEGGRRGEFERLAWMEPQRVEDEILIRVRDLNRELSRGAIRASVNTRAGTVTVDGTTYRVPQPNIDGRREVATCLHCGNQIRKGKTDWYVKEALRDWNTKLEQYLSGAIDLNKLLNESLARPRLLAKVKIVNRELVFESATKEDNEKLWKALEKLRKIWGDPDIPTEPIPTHEVRRITPILGTERWYQLFNPRQLLTLVKLVKLIREAGKKIEGEKLGEGWSKEDAFKYAEAVTTYLAIALARFVDHNNIVTLLHSSNPMGIEIAHALSMRGIAMQWNWGDTNPFIITRGLLRTNSFSKCLEKQVEALTYLISAISGSASTSRVLLEDATSLSKLEDERFDLIVTDPPYRDDVPYVELSDFYYVWLKRALSDVVDVGGVLVRRPRFLAEAFFDEFGNEVEVQWKRFAPREVSENSERSEVFGSVNVGGKNVPVGSFDYFKYLLGESFRVMATRVRDDGVLATYYAHTSPDAWEALLEAGWQNAGLRVSAAHALATESPQRVTARGAATLDMSIVVVWRKGVSGEALADEVYARAVEVCSEEATKYRKQGYSGVNLFVATLGCALSQFTQYKRVVGVRSLGELVERYIYPATAAAIARSLTGAEARLSPASQFYLLAKVLIDRGRRQRRRLDRTSAIILSIGTRTAIDQLQVLRVIERADGDLMLLEPAHSRDARGSIEELLSEKNLSPQTTTFRTDVDALHVLEYLALAITKDELRKRVEELRARNGTLIDEAIELAKILALALPEEEVERTLAQRLLEALDIRVGGLFDYSKR